MLEQLVHCVLLEDKVLLVGKPGYSEFFLGKAGELFDKVGSFLEGAEICFSRVNSGINSDTKNINSFKITG